MLKWVKIIQDKNKPVSGPLTKAMEYAKRLWHLDFQVSSVWLDKFKKCHKIKEKVISGESRSISEASGKLQF